jgi:ribosome-associated translation inhibitor RaiA
MNRMDIVFHSHHAPLSPRLQQRTERALRKLDERIGGATAASVLFEEDGTTRRVEIIVRARRNKRFVAEAEGRYLGPAVNVALDRLTAQVRAAKRVKKSESRRATRP